MKSNHSDVWTRLVAEAKNEQKAAWAKAVEDAKLHPHLKEWLIDHGVVSESESFQTKKEYNEEIESIREWQQTDKAKEKEITRLCYAVNGYVPNYDLTPEEFLENGRKSEEACNELANAEYEHRRLRAILYRRPRPKDITVNQWKEARRRFRNEEKGRMTDYKVDDVIEEKTPRNILVNKLEKDFVCHCKADEMRDGISCDPSGEHAHKGKNGWPRITIYKEKDDTAEHLVLYLTPEFRHMWQYDFCGFLYDVSDKRLAEMAERMQEDDAHAYDIAMLKIWIENEWNWKTLPDYKYKYLKTLMC